MAIKIHDRSSRRAVGPCVGFELSWRERGKPRSERIAAVRWDDALGRGSEIAALLPIGERLEIRCLNGKDEVTSRLRMAGKGKSAPVKSSIWARIFGMFKRASV